MAYLQVKNRAKSALATDILAGDTSLNVAGEGDIRYELELKI